MQHIILLMILIIVSTISRAADIEAGQAKAATCAACHGAKGVSNNPEWPNLAGQKEAYLRRQIIAFRDGHRQDPMMTSIVQPLTDDDVANLAAYYSTLPLK
jgi:cytochrome c553